jgi:threonyl-tRNA synthetase
MQALKNLYPGKIIPAMGPSTDDGFYYDFDSPIKITKENFPEIEAEMSRIIKANLPITKHQISNEEARKLFKDNPYKQEWINETENRRESISIFWTGSPDGENSFVDLCSGPHLSSTGEIKVFKLLSVAGAYWRGSEKNKMLTRIYGTAFPNQEELDKYLHQIEETKKRDHKKLGPQLELFFLHETAPGMPYWLPKGTIIYNKLLKFWREEHSKRNYQETITPLLNKRQLYDTSGHWDHYRDNMFISNPSENETYCLKPMNCPNAMVIFASKTRSYRDLPLRLSDCDTLHRHEKSGELNGLFRVQKFAQDDAHIFLTKNQIESEYKNIFEILTLFYQIFNLKFKIRLGTSPDDFMGDTKTWQEAESILKKILEESSLDYFIGKGEGAFYGPKLDILMEDCLGREWQTGTIQLDFQIPKQFDLRYTDENGQEKTPVVIHRVIYGSLERFIGILIEHFAAAFPVWLSPVQTIILPISEKTKDYSKSISEKLKNANVRTEIDESTESLGKKIRNAESQKIPYMLIVGEKEVQENLVSVRQRGERNLGQMTIEEFIDKISQEINQKVIF